MAEHGAEGGGGLGGSFVLIFFGVIVAFWFISGAGEGPGIFGTATSTDTAGSTTRNFAYERPRSQGSVEAELGEMNDEVKRLTEEVGEARLWGVRSPHAGSVRISRGDTNATDEDLEYLTLYNNGTEPITISSWRLESEVTGEIGHIPQGAEVPRSGRINDTAPIMLTPGENAIVISGDAPTGVSFRENMCTGYFEQYQDFHPALDRSCPYPKDEMEEFGQIALDDDRCYDFVASLPSCEVARVEAQDARLSSECEAFVESDLTYSGCVANHRYDPSFKGRTWRIYLGERGDLWRDEREIVKLLDETGKTVDVLRY
jgi:hypothetical protein